MVFVTKGTAFTNKNGDYQATCMRERKGEVDSRELRGVEGRARAVVIPLPAARIPICTVLTA